MKAKAIVSVLRQPTGVSCNLCGYLAAHEVGRNSAINLESRFTFPGISSGQVCQKQARWQHFRALVCLNNPVACALGCGYPQ